VKKVVLITGASTGIGLAAAALFLKRGHKVMATMRKPEECTLPASENLKTTRIDVTDVTSIELGVEETLRVFGHIDVVVNNAGYGLVGPFEATTKAQVERQFATNVLGLMDVVREILPIFRNQGHGHIINISSVGGRVTFPLYSSYHATKWAVEGFSESIHYELREFNIKVKLVEPGPIRTDFYERSMELVTKPGLTAYDKFIAKAMPYMKGVAATAPGPDLVAREIYRAAMDESFKMRYPVNALALLTLRKVLPDAVYQTITRSMIVR
jgi:short-subunit dehydrogenase